MSKQKKLVAIYVRKSRLKDDRSLEIENQVELLVDYANANNMNYKIFKEEGNSEDWSRPEFQKMLKELERGLYDGVLVTDQDRLTRDRVDFGLFVRFANKHSLLLYMIDKTLNFFNDDDVFTSGIQSEMDNHFMRMTKRKLRRGRIQAIKKGVYFGVAPFGYTKDKDKRLIPRQDEAKIIQEIFDMYVNKGMNQADIARNLNLRGKTVRSGEPISVRAIALFLSNLAYVGDIYYCLKDEDPIYVEKAHPQIVSDEIFNKAQTIRAERRHVPQKAKLGRYALSRLLVCPKCGQTLSFCMKYNNKDARRKLDKTRRELYVLNCFSSKGQKQKELHRDKPRCENNGIKASRLEEAVLTNLKKHLVDIDVQIERIINDDNSFANKISEKRKELFTQSKKLDEQKKRVQDGFKMGIYGAEEASNEIEEINKTKLQISHQLKELEDKDVNSEIERKEKLKKTIMEILTLNYEDSAKANELLQSVIDKIYYWKEEADSRAGSKPFVLKIEYKD